MQEETKMNLQGKRVLVFGTGKSGIGAADLLEETGAHVILFDGNEKTDKDAVLTKVSHAEDASVYAGELPKEVLESLDLVILSPGVPTVKKFYEMGLPVWGEVELAYRTSKGRVLAITGTNGKTTTTALLGKIMSDAEDSVFVVGNIGTPYTSKALEMKENSSSGDQQFPAGDDRRICTTGQCDPQHHRGPSEPSPYNGGIYPRQGTYRQKPETRELLCPEL